ncbi:uncharacterized protein VTP21DRAFT_4935 [Calcarisporiella thermophila]|uniref:uncharacterized protein n=1 Tax=Calcarisporiella thermophila TaxID=911321 RepID=UPI0037429B7F
MPCSRTDGCAARIGEGGCPFLGWQDRHGEIRGNLVSSLASLALALRLSSGPSAPWRRARLLALRLPSLPWPRPCLFREGATAFRLSTALAAQAMQGHRSPFHYPRSALCAGQTKEGIGTSFTMVPTGRTDRGELRGFAQMRSVEYSLGGTAQWHWPRWMLCGVA